jgi:chromosome segregation ATPase
MKAQFANERKRLAQAIAAETAKLESLRKVARQLETTQRKWNRMLTQGIDRMKTTLRHIRDQAGQGIKQTRESVSRIGQCDRRRREIAIVEQEIAELDEENLTLCGQLENLDHSVYGRQ